MLVEPGGVVAAVADLFLAGFDPRANCVEDAGIEGRLALDLGRHLLGLLLRIALERFGGGLLAGVGVLAEPEEGLRDGRRHGLDRKSVV